MFKLNKHKSKLYLVSGHRYNSISLYLIKRVPSICTPKIDTSVAATFHSYYSSYKS